MTTFQVAPDLKVGFKEKHNTTQAVYSRSWFSPAFQVLFDLKGQAFFSFQVG